MPTIDERLAAAEKDGKIALLEFVRGLGPDDTLAILIAHGDGLDKSRKTIEKSDRERRAHGLGATRSSIETEAYISRRETVKLVMKEKGWTKAGLKEGRYHPKKTP